MSLVTELRCPVCKIRMFVRHVIKEDELLDRQMFLLHSQTHVALGQLGASDIDMEVPVIPSWEQ